MAVSRSRAEAFGTIATAHLSPVRLNVLLGAMSVTVRASISGDSVAIGTWRRPSSSRSQWISSAMIHTSRRVHAAAMPSSSARSNTRPTGLCGLHSRNARVRGPSARVNASRSTV